MLRRSWVEIDLHTIETNYKVYGQAVVAGEIMAVVKADAYGHGATVIANRLQKLGCINFAVSNIDEAVQLRESGISGQILILGYTPISERSNILKYDITQTLLSEEYAEKLANPNMKAQFAIDSGMNRIGLKAENADECERIIRKYSSCFNLTGLFTHLCVADDISEQRFTKEQIGRFKRVVERVADLNLPYIHCMNSAGGLWCEPYGNLTRLGIILYGQKPSYDNKVPKGIKPALTWKSVVSQVKTVNKGDTIGYGRTYTAQQNIMVATITTGYADGYNRLLSNKGHVIIHGKVAPIIGNICMDQFMVDVTNIPETQAEDEVLLLCNQYDADDMAQDIGTIGYEIICGISKRVPRVYQE